MQLIQIKINEFGRLKFVLELENGRTVEFGGETIAEIIYMDKVIEVSMEALMDMRSLKAVYYELSEDTDLDGNIVYDVYEHRFVDGYNGLEVGECKLIGTWKREKTAQKHFDRLVMGI